ncbi:hypothetical protein [Virgisporangium ochraceum]|uniref:VWA domain-containing protein n=1 Tax=Virgisporangium ochraceum TaxID=65505 RepID=A0A8J4EF92_9ACTN|nr:hypothetical protein [Virgisporangium ochraceum]GIJ69822.1 hypothetical protein Voc01_047390 [Virgisporangium ochraceum]
MNAELIAQLTAELAASDEPLRVSRSGRITGPAGADAHDAAYAADAEAYALLALVPGTSVEQRAGILLRLLGASRTGMSAQTRRTVERVTRVLVLGLPAHTVGTVLLALRHRRANHKHVTRAALRLLTEHAEAATFVRTHRRMAVSIVEHALGKATARGVARALRTGEVVADVRRSFLRFVSDPALATQRLLEVYAEARVDEVAVGVQRLDLDLDGERPAVVTATNRGDLAATLVHRFRGGDSADLDAAQERYLAAAAAAVPRFPGRLALVIDRSASMDGYGEREWAVRSQVAALELVLRQRSAELVTVYTPGSGTDLAGGVVAALRERPDLVAVVSDGYENTYPGDLARVAATLPRLGVRTGVVFCTATFSHSDDLTLRRPAPGLPRRAFWHEADFASLVLWMLFQTEAADAAEWQRTALRERLSIVEGGAG